MPSPCTLDNAYDLLMLGISLLAFHSVMFGARRLHSWLIAAEVMPTGLFVIHYALLAFNVAWYECDLDLQRQVVRPALLFVLLIGAVVLIDGNLTQWLEAMRLRLVSVWVSLFQRSSAS